MIGIDITVVICWYLVDKNFLPRATLSSQFQFGVGILYFYTVPQQDKILQFLGEFRSPLSPRNTKHGKYVPVVLGAHGKLTG